MYKLVTVFGATGNQGSSIVRALLKNKQYIIRAVTRQPDHAGLALKALGPNVQVFRGDIENPKDCREALEGASAVYFSPHNLFDDLEYEQGKNLIDAAANHRTPHLVFGGADHAYAEEGIAIQFGYDKERLEGYIDSKRIPTTKLRVSFYYEEFLDQFLPRREEMPGPNEPTSWAVNLPMEGKPLHMISVKHMGNAVRPIIDNPQQYIGKTIGLSGGLYHVKELVEQFNKHCKPYTFYDGEETFEDRARLEYPDAEEVANLFEYYQRMTYKRDLELTRQLDPDTPTFEQWLQANKAAMMKALDWEAAMPDYFQPYKGRFIEPTFTIDREYWRGYLW